jgi:hypothetical protein
MHIAASASVFRETVAGCDQEPEAKALLDGARECEQVTGCDLFRASTPRSGAGSVGVSGWRSGGRQATSCDLFGPSTPEPEAKALLDGAREGEQVTGYDLFRALTPRPGAGSGGTLWKALERVKRSQTVTGSRHLGGQAAEAEPFLEAFGRANRSQIAIGSGHLGGQGPEVEAREEPVTDCDLFRLRPGA